MNYLYIIGATLFFLFLFTFVLNYAWIFLVLYLIYYIYKRIRVSLYGQQKKEQYYTQETTHRDDYTQDNSYQKSDVFDADYTVVDEEETSVK